VIARLATCGGEGWRGLLECCAGGGGLNCLLRYSTEIPSKLVHYKIQQAMQSLRVGMRDQDVQISAGWLPSAVGPTAYHLLPAFQH
jgi:hypothetical protein